MATKIMVIRHAEKPDGDFKGVQLDGSDDSESLIVRGWQRAGALTVLFDPSRGALQNEALAAPRHLFSSKHGVDKHSKRPFETIQPLSLKLRVKIHDHFKKDDYAAMVEAAMGCAGVVLIAWQHDFIPEIGNAITGNGMIVPQKWPSDRFDIVWVFTANDRGDWTFTQVPQLLLAGDKSSVIT